MNNDTIKALSELLAQDVATSENAVENPKMHAEKIALEMKRDLDLISTSCKDGLTYCLDAVQELARNNPEIDAESVVCDLTKASQIIDLDKAARELLEGKSWKEILEIQNNAIEILYLGAKEIFTQKRYLEATAAFTFLTTLDSKNYTFWIGLGHAAFHNNDFSLAINAYTIASLCNSTSIWPHIYAANVFEAKNDKTQALLALEEAQELIQATQEHNPELIAAIKNRIANLKL